MKGQALPPPFPRHLAQIPTHPVANFFWRLRLVPLLTGQFYTPIQLVSEI